MLLAVLDQASHAVGFDVPVVAGVVATVIAVVSLVVCWFSPPTY